MSNVESLRQLMATLYSRSTNQRSNPVYTVPYQDGLGFGEKTEPILHFGIVLHWFDVMLHLLCMAARLSSPTKFVLKSHFSCFRGNGGEYRIIPLI